MKLPELSLMVSLLGYWRGGVRALIDKFVQFIMADNMVAPSVDREQSMDKKFAGYKVELTPHLMKITGSLER